MQQYLTEDQLRAYLKSGRSVEQWLGCRMEETDIVLTWLRIDKEQSQRYSLSYFESLDEGDADFLDIYEFSSLDPDEPFGVITIFNSIDEVLRLATETYRASLAKYVCAGMIQEEYKNTL